MKSILQMLAQLNNEPIKHLQMIKNFLNMKLKRWKSEELSENHVAHGLRLWLLYPKRMGKRDFALTTAS